MKESKMKIKLTENDLHLAAVDYAQKHLGLSGGDLYTVSLYMVKKHGKWSHRASLKKNCKS